MSDPYAAPSRIARDSYLELARLLEFGDATDPGVDVAAANLAAAVAQAKGDAIIGAHPKYTAVAILMKAEYDIGIIELNGVIRAYSVAVVRGARDEYLNVNEFYSLRVWFRGLYPYVDRAGLMKEILAEATGNDFEEPFDKWSVRRADEAKMRRALRDANEELVANPTTRRP